LRKLLLVIITLLFAAMSFSDIATAGDKKRYKKGYKPHSISKVEKPRRQKVTSDYRPGYKNLKNNGYNLKPRPYKSDNHYRPNNNQPNNYRPYNKRRGGTWNYNYRYEYENKTKFYNDPYFWGTVAGAVGGLVVGSGQVYAEPGPIYAEPVCETYWVDYYDQYYEMWSKQPVQQCR
jgi:hypothetical protein